MIDIAVIAGVAGAIVALREIFGFLFNGHKKTIDYMAKKIIEHDLIKKPLETHENRLNSIEIKLDGLQLETRSFFLLTLENTLRRYYYELKDNFNPTIYRECFLKIKEPYKAKGGNGMVDMWDDILKKMYKEQTLGG